MTKTTQTSSDRWVVKVHREIAEIPAAAWDAFVKDNHPFLKHALLHAMEVHECVGKHYGWLPCHIAVYEQAHLCAAMPLYEKYNNYGEFVFDHAWAQAWQQQGLHYYPKLVSAIPYTPAFGQRLLCEAGREDKLFPILLQTAWQLVKMREASGLHVLFPEANTQDWLEKQQPLIRHDCQFHWFNRGYKTFDDFLQQLSAKKRKNIRQERRKVEQAGVRFRVLNGHTASADDWDQFACFYQKTFDEKWSTATFNAGFFKAVAKALPEQIILIMADYEEACIAGALLYQSDTHLYGRHWGCTEPLDGLHFETCYYQGIEYAIQQGLQCFEPGAQGEHKIARGFVPVLTRSSHFMQPNPFQASLEKFVAHERDAVASYHQDCQAHVPYKS